VRSGEETHPTRRETGPRGSGENGSAHVLSDGVFFGERAHPASMRYIPYLGWLHSFLVKPSSLKNESARVRSAPPSIQAPPS
jgi:hypothetical protein